MSFPTCESVETVLHRVAIEVGSAARDLAVVEQRVAALVAGGVVPARDVEQFQSIDRLGQQLRALEAFLHGVDHCRCGRIDVEAGVEHVWLESVRARLLGSVSTTVKPGEAELW